MRCRGRYERWGGGYGRWGYYSWGEDIIGG